MSIMNKFTNTQINSLKQQNTYKFNKIKVIEILIS